MSDQGFCLGDFMKDLFIRFLKDEDGQTSTEYILLLAVVAMIVFKFKKEADTQLTSITNSVFGGAKGIADQLGELQ